MYANNVLFISSNVKTEKCFSLPIGSENVYDSNNSFRKLLSRLLVGLEIQNVTSGSTV